MLPLVENYYENDWDDNDNSPNEDEDVSKGFRHNTNEARPQQQRGPGIKATTQSEIAAMGKSPEEQQEMLNNSIQQYIRHCMKNAKVMEMIRECCRKYIWQEVREMKNLDMTHSEQYYSGANVLGSFLNMLQSIMQSQVHQFPERFSQCQVMKQAFTAHGTIVWLVYRDR